MSYIVQGKVRIKKSAFYVFIEGYIPDQVPQPVERWFMALFSVRDDVRVGSWPIDDRRSEGNKHIGPVNLRDEEDIDAWLKKHNAAELGPGVKAKIKSMRRRLVKIYKKYS